MMHNINVNVSSNDLAKAGFSYPWDIEEHTQYHNEVIDWWMKCELGQWLLLNGIQVSINIPIRSIPERDWVDEIFPLV